MVLNKSHWRSIVITVVFLMGIAAFCWRRGDPLPLPANSSATLPQKLGSFADQQLMIAERKTKALPRDPNGYAELASAYMNKARETGDGAFYARAEAACHRALELDPKSYAAIRLIPWIYSGQHRFREALLAARKSLQADSKDPWNYGTLADALIELGEYEEAARAVQQMVDLRPDVNAYTRAAHIRELYGDSEGAIEAMGMAVRASSSRDREHSAWCRIQLGNLLFNTGRLSEAEGQYQAALKIFPNYHYALAGMGRIRTAQKRNEEAVRYFEQSIAFLPTHDAVVALGDLHALQNHEKEATSEFQLLETIEQINRSHGVQPEAHMAMFFADHDERLQEALQIAQQHARDRHDVRTLDTLAWALFKNGRYTEALIASQKALRLGTKDALLYYHLGMIQSQLGHRTDAVVALQKALHINPYFHPKFADEARRILQQPGQIAMRRIENS